MPKDLGDAFCYFNQPAIGFKNHSKTIPLRIEFLCRITNKIINPVCYWATVRYQVRVKLLLDGQNPFPQ